MKILLTIFIYILLSIIRPGSGLEYETRYVSVLFRHGDRAPDVAGNENFPNDPYVNCSFFPEGPGGLTNIGKRRLYALGQFLRDQYDDFLGRIYVPSEVTARSINSQRMIMSLNLVLAGLYPPEPEQMWDESMNWQPAVISLPDAKDNTLVSLCPLFFDTVDEAVNSPEFREELKPIYALLPKLTELTGRQMTHVGDMYFLYHALMAEQSMGLELPSWTSDFFPDGPVLNGTLLWYRIANSNDQLKRLNPGKFLKVIIDSMLNVVKGTTKRKIDLLSANEISVASLLLTLGIDVLDVPSYGSSVIIELLENSDEFFVRVFYYSGIPAKLEEKTLPGCKSPCPLKDFVESMINIIPIDGEPNCS